MGQHLFDSLRRGGDLDRRTAPPWSATEFANTSVLQLLALKDVASNIMAHFFRQGVNSFAPTPVAEIMEERSRLSLRLWATGSPAESGIGTEWEYASTTEFIDGDNKSVL